MTTIAIVDWKKKTLELKEIDDKVKPHLVFDITYCGAKFIGVTMFELPAGKTAQLNVRGMNGAIERPFTDLVLTSTDPAVVSVDQSGLLTWVSAGNANIMGVAKNELGDFISGSLDITDDVAVVPALTLELTATLI